MVVIVVKFVIRFFIMVIINYFRCRVFSGVIFDLNFIIVKSIDIYYIRFFSDVGVICIFVA